MVVLGPAGKPLRASAAAPAGSADSRPVDQTIHASFRVFTPCLARANTPPGVLIDDDKCHR